MTIATPRLRLRPLAPSDAEPAASLTRHTPWPLRADDWRDLLRLAEGVAAVSDSGLIGAGLSWKFNGGFGAISAALVSPAHQGLGVEARIAAHLLASLQDRAVFMHAPSQTAALYEGLGFARQGTLHQHQGVAAMAPLVALDPGDRIRPLGRDDPEQLPQLDELASGIPRGRTIRQLLDSAGCVVLENEGTAKGYAFCRETGRGWIIGPVAAPSLAGAQALISYWLNQRPGKPVRLDSAPDAGLSSWLESLGLQRVNTISTLARQGSYTPAGPPFLWAMMLQSLG